MNEFEAKQKEVRGPRQYKIYKGITGKHGAMRLNLKEAYADDIKKPEGVVFLEMAPTTAPNVYGWSLKPEQKAVFALSVNDIGKLLLFFRTYTDSRYTKDNVQRETWFHDNSQNNNLDKGSNTTSLTISKEESKDSFFWSIYQKKNGTELRISLPVSQDEMLVISTLFQAAIPAMLAW